MVMQMGGYDPFLSTMVGGAMGAAWGANPATFTLAPGAHSVLSNFLQNDMMRGNAPLLAALFPQPTFATQLSALQFPIAFPPMLQQGGFGVPQGGFSGLPATTGNGFSFFG